MTFTDIAQIVTAVAAIGGVIMGIKNSGKIQEVHLSINSRMDQLLKAAAEAAHAAGAAQEKTEAALALAKSTEQGEVSVPAQQLRIETPREK